MLKVDGLDFGRRRYGFRGMVGEGIWIGLTGRVCGWESDVAAGGKFSTIRFLGDGLVAWAVRWESDSCLVGIVRWGKLCSVELVGSCCVGSCAIENQVAGGTTWEGTMATSVIRRQRCSRTRCWE